MEARQLEWELRQNDLENTIQKYEEERDKFFMSATATEVGDLTSWCCIVSESY